MIYEGSYFDDGGTISDPTYWYNDVAYYIERTHKLTLDKPCITIKIPFDRLGLDEHMDQVVLSDFALRKWVHHIEALNKLIYNRSRSDKDNGAFYCFRPTNVVLKRNASFVETFSEKRYLCLMITVQLPFKNNDKAMRMLCKMLPKEVEELIANWDRNHLNTVFEMVQKQNRIREWLKHSDYCAFIANGSILPRNKEGSGPLEGALPFASPEDIEIEICGLRGMGIKHGVTVITGGGYSGKSTMLDALNSGIYNHSIGDGREFVLTDQSAMEISAEEGRSIKNINITPFIKWIPQGSAEQFSTDYASGSTSQAANIMEAINYGCKLILIDEDRSATNFMIQDNKMRSLIKREPITPFTERVRELYEVAQVSSVLVIGGSGEFLSVADQIILMDNFVPINVTQEAKRLCEHDKPHERIPFTKWEMERNITSNHFSSYPQGSGTEKLKVSAMGYLMIGDEQVDIRGLYNITSPAQVAAIAFLIRKIAISNQDHIIILHERIKKALDDIEREGVDIVFSSFFPGFERWLELPRINEVLSVINRMKHLNIVQ
ncbi:P-loop domain-containing protein [Paenibacillus qinlingensis]|uniref:ABC-class ATPase n=1 Tax=Paenibacillus qinlingensis TaxID=1837343 RepID=A0ABU1NX50_9BACL|nr:P-loop domain-containing protein [Paenibacillus qinlingensis]MDR6551869.1 putative ABC-class ATPase [Paenibacillus qinlingensis]